MEDNKSPEWVVKDTSYFCFALGFLLARKQDVGGRLALVSWTLEFTKGHFMND